MGLTLDVADLDDIGGILIMAVVFALIPVLEGGGSLWVPISETLLSLVVELGLFAVLCYLFTRYMLPRAEICMIVMHNARLLGEDLISSQLYSGMVLVSAVTCLLSPLWLRYLLSHSRDRSHRTKRP